MKVPTLKRSALVMSTCPSMDNHGIVQARFTYRDAEPFVFTVSLLVKSATRPEATRVSVELDRAMVHGLLIDGVFGEILVLGETSVKVRESARHQTCFRLPAREGDEGVRAMFVVSTGFVKQFIEDTYRVVPLEAENAFVSECVERFLAETLGGAK